MDETLALCAIDLSGRPYLNYDVCFTTEQIGTLDTEMIREFFYAVSYSAGDEPACKDIRRDQQSSYGGGAVQSIRKGIGCRNDGGTSFERRMVYERDTLEEA